MTKMALLTTNLWQRRFTHYMKESIGYWQYAARSNFIGFTFFLVIVASYYYAKNLQRLPTDYPYWWIVLLLLTPTLSSSPIRTLLRSADRMFLLPAEDRMGAYFRQAIQYSFVLQGFWTFLAWVVLWPLYHHCAGTREQHFLLMLAHLLLLKIANLLGSWQESRLVNPRARLMSVSYRWIATTVIILVQFQVHLLGASGAALLLILGWLLAKRFAAHYPVGWDYLIARERQQQACLYSFFNWFVDVPHLGTRITRRSWISGMARWIPFEQKAAYLYLYMKTLHRTELFAIIVRLTLLGILAIAVSSSEGARVAIFVLVALISLVQLTSLARAHRYTFWLDMYPLDRTLKAGAVAFNIWLTSLFQTCVLSIPLLIRSPWLYALVPLMTMALVSFLCGVVLRRKFARNDLLES